MKKLILLMFLILGITAFSRSLDKVVVIISNDDYGSPAMTGTVNRGGLANAVFSGKKENDLAQDIYKSFHNTKKLEFLITKKDEGIAVAIVKFFSKTTYPGEIVITEIADKENETVREYVKKNSNWKYNVYKSAKDIPGTVKIEGGTEKKGDAVEQLLEFAKKLTY